MSRTNANTGEEGKQVMQTAHPNAVYVSVVFYYIYIKSVHRAEPSLLYMQNRTPIVDYQVLNEDCINHDHARRWLLTLHSLGFRSCLITIRSHGLAVLICQIAVKTHHTICYRKNDSPAGKQLFWFRAINASKTMFVESAASLRRRRNLSRGWSQIHKAVRDVILN